METEALGVMIPIIAIVGIITMVIYLRKYQFQERMAMIDKGVDPKLFNINKPRYTSAPLRASLLMIGAGIGLLLGYFLDRAFYMEEVAYFSMLFIFGGLGLGGSYLIEERKLKEESSRKTV